MIGSCRLHWWRHLRAIRLKLIWQVVVSAPSESSGPNWLRKLDGDFSCVFACRASRASRVCLSSFSIKSARRPKLTALPLTLFVCRAEAANCKTHVIYGRRRPRVSAGRRDFALAARPLARPLATKPLEPARKCRRPNGRPASRSGQTGVCWSRHGATGRPGMRAKRNERSRRPAGS